jgi:very-short-patch-repair endonuclease
MRGPNEFTTKRSRELRRNQTSAEAKLWFYIRGRQVDGYKFVRQAPVVGYFADFLCRELKLILEIDGATHSTEMELARDARGPKHSVLKGMRSCEFGMMISTMVSMV